MAEKTPIDKNYLLAQFRNFDEYVLKNKYVRYSGNTSSSQIPSYSIAGFDADVTLTSPSPSTIVPFNRAVFANNVEWNAEQHGFILKSGKTYELEAQLRSFNSTGFLYYTFYNITDEVEFGLLGCIETTSLNNFAQMPATAIITPDKDIVVRVQLFSGATITFTSIILAAQSRFKVIEISTTSSGGITTMTQNEFNMLETKSNLGIIGLVGNGSIISRFIDTSRIDDTSKINSDNILFEADWSMYYGDDKWVGNTGTSTSMYLATFADDALYLAGNTNKSYANYDLGDVNKSITIYGVFKANQSNSQYSRIIDLCHSASAQNDMSLCELNGKLVFSTWGGGNEIVIDYDAQQYFTVAITIDSGTKKATCVVNKNVVGTLSLQNTSSIISLASTTNNTSEWCDMYVKYFAIVEGVNTEEDVLSNVKNIIEHYNIS